VGIYINRTQIHECGNLERGRAVSFMGTHISDLLCSVKMQHGERAQQNEVAGAEG
jgi:hypothetical protein